jgi:serine/threonine-protein kinase
LLLKRRQDSRAQRSLAHGSVTGLPLSLLRKSAKRLQIVSATNAAMIFVAWFLLALLEGKLHNEWATPLQWGGPVALILSSCAVFALARWSRVSGTRVETIGLSYEVVAAWCMPVTTYYGAFRDLPVEWITFDRVGMSPVVIWVLFFAVLVPARPNRAVVAMLASLASVPATYAILMSVGDAPAIDAGRFLDTFVVPYLFVVVFAYIAARIIYGLGTDVRHAQEVGSYRLLDRIGRGGMGEVWRARHHLLARPAAVKLIRRAALGSDPQATEVQVVRFEQEAQVTASLQSPHTVQLFDFGEAEDGSLYYVMELLEGVNLDSLVRRFGPLEPARAVHVLRQVCHSLEEAHQRGLVHRDIKPANIVLCESALEYDFVKVLDFGLVKAQTAVEGHESVALTAVDVIAGTPAFIAPEVALGTEVDGRADIYSLGCVAYWLLTGRDVFVEKTPMAMIVSHVERTPEPPSAHAEAPLPAALDELISQCLAKDPSGRPQSAGALAEALARIELERPWTQADAAAWWTRHRPREPE